ncbi:MAG: pyrimidine dimer DNA glycosylase/endonuclease V [Gammaproteobacteria bacterium]|nr:pyrimidine dimer DNA glycosylase/endonuclease V [Gammaproteobacteria bacterium]
MRLWTVHPRYLDAAGLVAVWREGLLAQAVLRGQTRGYRQHPQLLRFRQQADPLVVIGGYLAGIADEADRRGYRFDRTKIAVSWGGVRIAETQGQLAIEWALLKAKLARRSSAVLAAWKVVTLPEAHPVFWIIPGCVRDWEKASYPQ